MAIVIVKPQLVTLNCFPFDLDSKRLKCTWNFFTLFTGASWKTRTGLWTGLDWLLSNGVGIDKKWSYSSESSATLVTVLAITHSECQMRFSRFRSHAIPRMPAKQPDHSLLGGRYQIASHLIGPHLISIRHQRLTEKKTETMEGTPEIYSK